MARYGSRWFRCDECQKLNKFSVREQNRAGRLRCTGCGSARLTVSSAGADRQAEINAAIAEQTARTERLTR